MFLSSLTRRLVATDDSRSFSSKMRARRWQRLLATFPDLPEMRVLDVGGEVDFWRRQEVRPAHVTLLNLSHQQSAFDWMNAVVGDGCELPANLGSFDLVLSNSVIEHVGGHWRRERFADQIRAAAPHYWVQTPHRHFPIEPHVVFPFFQYLPPAAQAAIIVRWPIGNFRTYDDRDVAMRVALEIELLSPSEMAVYFPDARIERETLAGLTKSLIAVRS